ncbi:Ig-like domain-containing protein [Deinococcus hohokamensis]|uniref:Ig domain-containing protein n=1 Tax=Deinococcus hohokamensis TaxID=309883 RepID=A0ABV9I6I7_9DEIO
MFILPWLLTLTLTGGGTSPTPQPLPGPHPGQPVVITCPAMLIPPVSVEVRNERGQGLPDATFPLTLPPERQETRQVTVQRERTGRYTVTVNRPWYKPVTVRGVVVKENQRGPVAPTPLVIYLQPFANAPRVRGFGILGSELHTAVWPYKQRLRTFVDAPGVNPEEIWTSSRPDVASIDQRGHLVAKCRKEAAWTVITAMLKADPSKTASVRFGAGGALTDCSRAQPGQKAGPGHRG